MTRAIVSPCGAHEYAPIVPGVDVLFILQRKPTDAEHALCARIAVDNGYRTSAVQWVDTRRNKRVAQLTTATGRERINQATQCARIVVWCCEPYFRTMGSKAHCLGLGTKRPYVGAKIRGLV